MATENRSVGNVRETCQACDAETHHRVAVEICTESAKQENAEFSREPYRVSECTSCGEVTKTRMNNA